MTSFTIYIVCPYKEYDRIGRMTLLFGQLFKAFIAVQALPFGHTRLLRPVLQTNTSLQAHLKLISVWMTITQYLLVQF